MILADTSVWIGHFRGSEPELAVMLQEGRVVMHPIILGELALGDFTKRKQVLGDLAALPFVTVAMEAEVLRFIEAEKLFGVGIGYVGVCLLAAVRLTPGVRLWTRDKRLGVVAGRFGGGVMTAMGCASLHPSYGLLALTRPTPCT